MPVETVNIVAAALTIAAQVAIVVVVVQLIAARKGAPLKGLAAFFGKHAILLGFLASFGALLASLYYSNMVGYEPCVLCWYQRILLWPQAIVFGLALFKGKDRSVVDYMLALSTIGALIAAYHIYIEFGGAGVINCGALEGAVSCSRQYVREFNYITMPVMSLTTFAGIIVTMLAARLDSARQVKKR